MSSLAFLLTLFQGKIRQHKSSLGLIALFSLIFLVLLYRSEKYDNTINDDIVDWNITISHFEQRFQVQHEFCEQIIQIGYDPHKGRDQDAYRICMDKRLNIQPGKCLVYSFGIGDDWTFDDFMAKNLSCQVFSFDPSLSLDDGYQRSVGNLFYKYGLSAFDEYQSVPENDSFVRNQYLNSNNLWNLKKLTSIKILLEHEDQVLDFLKIDTEGSEVLALEQAINDEFLQQNVKQVLIEWHLWDSSLKHDTKSLRKVIEVYSRLFSSGFRLFFKGKNANRNLKTGVFPFTCFVNTKFL